MSPWILQLLVGGAVALASADAEKLPGREPIEDFERTVEWSLELDGALLPSAEIYFSRRQVAYLIVVPAFELGYLVSPRGRSVQAIAAGLLERSAGEPGAVLAGDAVAGLAGEYRRDREGAYAFELGGRRWRLARAPVVLGVQSAAELRRRDPVLAHRAEAYARDKGASLAPMPEAHGERIRVRVFFGSWSPICQRIVPKIAQLEQRWASSGVRFEFYGLPRPISDDPVAVEAKVRGVPTAVVLVDDREIARLTGRDLDTPEVSLARVLAELGPQ